MNRVVRWFGNNRWPLLSFIAVFVLLGISLTPYKLPDPFATLWGSALGAMAAVAGAMWVAERQATLQRRNAASLVLAMFYPTVWAIHDLTNLYGMPSREVCGDHDDEPDTFSREQWEEIHHQADRVFDNYNEFIRKIHRYESALNLLSPNSLLLSFSLETTLDSSLQRVVSALKFGHNQGVYGEPIFIAQSPTWSTRHALMTLDRDIQDLITDLDKESLQIN